MTEQASYIGYVGRFYLMGMGTPKDEKLGRAYIYVAAQLGDEKALEMLVPSAREEVLNSPLPE